MTSATPTRLTRPSRLGFAMILGACLGLLFFFASGMAALGVERFPPPEFDPGYTMPATPAPAARAQGWIYLDGVVLLGALSLAAYFVHVKRSRKWLFWMTVFSVLYFGFYRKGCVCSVGSVQDVSLALFNSGYTVPVGVLLFFLLPIVFSMFVGRVFCSSVCPLGAIQDLVVVKPIKVPDWLESGLSVIPFVWLGTGVLLAATGSLFLFCSYDPFVSFFRMGGSVLMLSLGVVFLGVGMFIGRPYCRFLCPYGALLSLFSRFAKYNVHLMPDECVQCQICDVTCPYGAILDPTGTPPVGHETRQNRKLWIWLALLPALVWFGAWLGHQAGGPLSKLHGTVQLAEQIAAEDSGQLKDDTNASRAFRQRARSAEELFATARQIRAQFGFGGWILGGFVGLVVAAKLVGLAAVVRRCAFEPDRASCVACGRCYTYCPTEIVRLKRELRLKSIPLQAAPKP